jgi:ribosome-associated protein
MSRDRSPKRSDSRASRPERVGRRPSSAKQKPPVKRPEDPTAGILAHDVATLLLDKKAVDVLILDVRDKASYADYFVIASGESERQVSAMAEYVEEKLRERQMRPLGVEGQESGSWVLLDFGEVVTHLFCVDIRAFYDLEGLWSDVPREKVA